MIILTNADKADVLRGSQIKIKKEPILRGRQTRRSGLDSRPEGSEIVAQVSGERLLGTLVQLVALRWRLKRAYKWASVRLDLGLVLGRTSCLRLAVLDLRLAEGCVCDNCCWLTLCSRGFPSRVQILSTRLDR